MEAMDQQRLTIEAFMRDAFVDFSQKLPAKLEDSSLWFKSVFIIFLPFYLLAILLFYILIPILVCIRLAITHADRVVFVLASSFLTFYQVPREVFYIYMAVRTVTGFFQFVRYHSTVRDLFLRFLSWISCGKSNMLLRKFTTLHFSNPFNRCFTRSQVIFVPMGLEIQSSDDIEIFNFPVSEHLNFDETVGTCKIKVETLDDITGSSTIRGLYVEAPWGNVRFVVNMEDDNLGRLISYFNRVIETNCTELICTPATMSGNFQALSIFGAIKYFNSGLPLFKLERRSPLPYLIN